MAEVRTGGRMTKRQIMVVFAGVMLGMFLAALDQTIVATALPRIVADLHGLEHLSWVVTAYLLASTVTVPLYGRLSDLYGRRSLFLVAISVFLAGSALAGLSRSMGELIVFRGIQGIGAGGILALAMTIIGDLFSPRERGRYQGFTGAVFAASSVIGPLVGGYLTDQVSWRWIFYVNLPIGAVALFVVATTMHLPFVRREHRIDYLGAATLMAGVACLLLVAVWGGTTYTWTSAEILGLAVSSVGLLVAFIAIELRHPEPILPLDMFRNRVFTVANLAALLIGASLFGTIVYIPLFVQGVIGSSATNSGVVLIPLMLGLIVSSVVSGQVVSRTGRYRVFPIAGTLVALVAFLLLTRMDVNTTSLEAIAIMVVMGLGIGQMFQVYILVVQNGVERHQMGIATAASQFFRSIGGTFGVAIFGAILSNRLSAELAARLGSRAGGLSPARLLQPGANLASLPPAAVEAVRHALAAALHTVFLAGVPLAVLALVPAFLLPEVPLRTVAHIDAAAELAAELGQADAAAAEDLATTAVELEPEIPR